jgi:two-component system OmpR family response regulator
VGKDGRAFMKEAAGDGRRILIVDDESSITELVSMALRCEGFAVVEAHNGQQALEAVAVCAPDLVVLDVMLPDFDGFEVARRARDSGAVLPIVFLSGRDDPEAKVRGLTLGDDYLTKPFSVEELVARIRAILRRLGMSRGRSSLDRDD